MPRGITERLLSRKEILQAKRIAPITEDEVCIYFLINNGFIVYIGKSERLRDRIREHTHKRQKKIFNEVRSVAVPKYGSENIEARYIHKFSPLYNQTMPRNTCGLRSEHLLRY